MARLEQVYAGTHAQSLINRMLALDAKFTLADNDLPKVTRACEIAGVDVAFPLLHEAVVGFSAALPPDFKLRGAELRYFFKAALRDFLPAATIAKRKHGFGLPAGVWLRDHPPVAPDGDRRTREPAPPQDLQRHATRRALDPPPAGTCERATARSHGY
jgi:asparagine synthase (glutamine-hydrolysing)